jgi:hypothetical protein
MFYFNKLPLELQYYINDIVLDLFKKDHQNNMNPLFKELECMWYWVLYGSCINSRFGMHEPIYIYQHQLKSNPMINYLKISNCLPYINPSNIIMIKKHPYYKLNYKNNLKYSI